MKYLFSLAALLISFTLFSQSISVDRMNMEYNPDYDRIEMEISFSYDSCDYFFIQSSTDAINWTTMTLVDVSPEDFNKNNFIEYLIDDPVNGVNFYRMGSGVFYNEVFTESHIKYIIKDLIRIDGVFTESGKFIMALDDRVERYTFVSASGNVVLNILPLNHPGESLIEVMLSSPGTYTIVALDKSGRSQSKQITKPYIKSSSTQPLKRKNIDRKEYRL